MAKKILLKKMKKKKKYSEVLITGTFIGNARGFGFVEPEADEADAEKKEDIFIPADYVCGALNKDTVQVSLLPGEGGGRRREGVVVRILERGVSRVVGTYEKNRSFGFVVSDDMKFNRDIFVAPENAGIAKNGDKVIVEITDYGSHKKNPGGVIREILGNENDPGTDILSIARAMELPMEFTEREKNQALRVPDHVLPADLEGREDLRSWQIVTIDGPDAKDLDDAVSLTEEEDGYTLGVHIADVSNYVQEHSALDREALKRGTSVYLADRVIPMLPERLSNGICSLNAGEDRLTLSVIMQLDRMGKITGNRIVESVIRAGERMSYPDVRAILEDHDENLCERYREYVPMFKRMLIVSELIRARRKKRGAIDFDFPEARVILDETGKPTDIVAEEANCATRIIEDFMLSANETVAEEFKKAKIPFIYRVHEDPDPDKVEELLSFVRGQGVKIDKTHQKIKPLEIQKALKRIEGKPNEPLISRVILRSMQQARYETQCKGHFGLAAKYYCHFTSPIRRYPDLQIHRIIRDTLRGRMKPEKLEHYAEILDDVAVQCSNTERRADEVERETEKLKKAQYMQAHIGEEFEGIISSVTGWGLYVELPNTVEGLVRIAEIRDDYYTYDEENHTLQGKLSGKLYRLGDTVRVKMSAADLRARTIDFELT